MLLKVTPPRDHPLIIRLLLSESWLLLVSQRMRNAVLRQTGFLEPNTNNLFSDHVEDHPEDQFEDHYEDGGLEALAIPL